LIILLFLRFVLGWFEVSKYSQNTRLRFEGNIDNVYQTNAECIIELGRFFVNLRDDCSFSRMDVIEVIGTVDNRVIDRFFGRLWLNSAEIVSFDRTQFIPSKSGLFSTKIVSFRENLVDRYRRFLPEPESSLVAGIVLGYKHDIGQRIYGLMVESGTIHIAVASGYNVMLLGGTVMSLLLWVCRRGLASVACVLAMAFYALLAGGDPPVIRAVIMGGVVFLGSSLGKRVVTWWILLVTGSVMVLVSPEIILSVSFQLSMMASVGLMVVEPWMKRYLEEKHEMIVEFLSGSGLTTSLATMFTTMPIIWWHFGRVSWIGILSNTLILPLVPMLMITGAFMQILPGVFSWPTFVLAHWMVLVIEFFGK